MGLTKIGLGNQPGDGLGDGGRTGGAKINAMFEELFYIGFVKDARWNIKRRSFNVSEPNPTNFLLDDHVSGWVNTTTKDRWVEGIVLDNTIVMPDDIDNAAKFFITNQAIKAD